MKIIPLCLILLLINCSKEKKQDIFFSHNLYQEILRYQKNNPIPKTNLNLFSIYDVSFSKDKDTIISISISPDGIYDDNNSFGIYRDSILKPTYVIDAEKLGEKFVKIYKKDSIQSYIIEGTPPHSDMIYPVYKYKIQGDKLILIDSLR